MIDNLCAVCEDKGREKNAELCNLCLDHVQKGKIFFVEIKNGSENDPSRTGRVLEIDRSVVEQKIQEPMKSIILTLGFTFVTREMVQTLELE